MAAYGRKPHLIKFCFDCTPGLSAADPKRPLETAFCDYGRHAKITKKHVKTAIKLISDIGRTIRYQCTALFNSASLSSLYPSLLKYSPSPMCDEISFLNRLPLRGPAWTAGYLVLSKDEILKDRNALQIHETTNTPIAVSVENARIVVIVSTSTMDCPHFVSSLNARFWPHSAPQ